MNIVSKFAGPVSRSNTVNNSRWQDTTPFLLQVFSLLLILSVNSVAYGQPLSIQFSQKNQLKTGMTWIKFKPKLVLAPSHRAPRKSKFDPVDPVESGDQNGRMPYSAVGKLLFTKDDGKISSCSAAFAGSNDVIVTAAHCVMTSSGDWNENFLFIRAYGSENQDVYAIQCVSVPGRWGELTDANLLPFDYAFLRSTRKSTVGSLGITNGQPPGKLTIVGYSDSHYEGRHLVRLPTDVVLERSDLPAILSDKAIAEHPG